MFYCVIVRFKQVISSKINDNVKQIDVSRLVSMLTSTTFSPFGAPWTNEVTKGICIQVQRCSKPTHNHAAS